MDSSHPPQKKALPFTQSIGFPHSNIQSGMPHSLSTRGDYRVKWSGKNQHEVSMEDFSHGETPPILHGRACVTVMSVQELSLRSQTILSTKAPMEFVVWAEMLWIGPVVHIISWDQKYVMDVYIQKRSTFIQILKWCTKEVAGILENDLCVSQIDMQ
jgi:hypothetical protein